MEEQKRKKGFMDMIVGVGSPVVRQLLLEAIDKVKSKESKNKLTDMLNDIIPATPLSARNIMFDNKKFYLVFQPCTDVKEYNIDKELDKVRNLLPEEQIDYFMKEVSITLSVIPNLYQKIIDDNTEFADKLTNALPADRKDIFTNLIEHESSTVCMFNDGLRFALYINTDDCQA